MANDIPLSVMGTIIAFTDLMVSFELHTNGDIEMAISKIKELYKDEPDSLPTVLKILQALKEYRNS